MKGPSIRHNGPASSILWYIAARIYFTIFRWTVVDHVPDHPKMVVIACPHTTNWDMPFMVAAAGILRVRINWLGKHTLFKFPYGWFMRLTGGLPVDRRGANGLVSSAAQIINNKEKIILAVAASGTRSKKDYWKSGFYHIAREAGVPIVCGYLDYAKKECGLGMSLIPTGDIQADMDKIRDFYKDKRGKYPEKRSRIRLRVEDELEAQANASQGPATGDQDS